TRNPHIFFLFFFFLTFRSPPRSTLFPYTTLFRTLIDDIISKVFRSKVKIVTEENHMPYDRITQLQSRMIIGTKQTLKAMNNNEVEEVFIASDVDAFISNQLIEAAKQRDIPYTMV